MPAAARAFLPYMIPNNILAAMPDAPRGFDRAFVPIRVVHELSDEVVQWLAQMAEFWNADAKEQGKKLRPLWSRKSVGETIVTQAAEEFAKEMAPTIEAFGPMPRINLDEAKDKKAKARFRQEMAAYVRKIHAGKGRTKR